MRVTSDKAVENGLNRMAVTKTLGPLHLEDLEPHRFEDLVRQLLYDFRPWRDLEATGRSGGDRGFDARAWELVSFPVPEMAEDQEDTSEADPQNDRQWLIQCKREKAIGPKKMTDYLKGLPDPIKTELHGLIFVAACDFSISTRDAFYDQARKLGFSEVKLWGKAEIEDQLFQPKNDNLLFAYFGVSLQMRRRSLKTEVRSRMAIKRKARKALHPHSPVVVVDASDDRYPYLDDDKSLSRAARGRWQIFDVAGLHVRGVLLQRRRHFAYIDPDGEHWDFAETMNDAIPHDDPWRGPLAVEGDWKIRSREMQIWDALQEDTKGWFEVNVVLPYDQIIEIDLEGDEDLFRGPVIYTQPFQHGDRPPIADYSFVTLAVNGSHRSAEADMTKRVKKFGRSNPSIDGNQ